MQEGEYAIEIFGSGVFKDVVQHFSVDKENPADANLADNRMIVEVQMTPGTAFYMVGRAAPELRDIHHWAFDKSISLEESKGKVTLLCIGSMDSKVSSLSKLDLLDRRFGQQGFQVVLVDASGIQDIEEWIGTNDSGIRAASAIRDSLDFEGPYFSVGADYRTEASTGFLIDRNGIVRSVWGDHSPKLDSAVESLLDEEQIQK